MSTNQTPTEHIYNWLKIGFLQSNGKISEFFYFDKRDNQFFSILTTDFFHFDENYRVPENANSTYSESTLKLLADRMKRIENTDESIISIPRIKANNDEELNEEQLIQKIEIFLANNFINLTNVSIWDIGSGNVTFDLTSNDSTKQKKWWQIWK